MGTWVQSLASLSGLRIWRCRELWCRPAVAAPIGPLAGELPYAAGAALKKKRPKEKETTTLKRLVDTSEWQLTTNFIDENLSWGK